MKQLLFSLLFSLVTFATVAQEQQAPRERPTRDREFKERPTREQMAERQLTMLTEKLSLTPEQQQKVKSLNENLAQRMESARSSNNREDMHVYQQQHKTEIKKILTPEQKVIYEELEKENQQRWKSREERGNNDRPRKPRKS
jgi:Spy/CpxP family protein refolding chaperone